MGYHNCRFEIPSCPMLKGIQCVLGRPFAATLDAIASLIHIKLKYHNEHNKPITINLEYLGKKKI